MALGLGLAAIGLGSKLMNSGGDEPDYPKVRKSDFQKQLQEYAQRSLNEGAPQYEGPTTTEMPEIYGTLSDTISQQIAGETLGMSEEEMGQYMNQTTDRLNQQKQEGIQGTIQRMNQRGLLSSDMTSSALNQVGENYADSLADAQTQLQLQNEQVKRNQLQNALGMGMNLGQWQTGVNQQNVANQMNNWYRQQQMNWQPFQMGMNYMQGVEMPFQQMKYGNQNQQAQREQQSSDNFWGTLGSMAGSFMGGPGGEALGGWLFG